MIKFKKEDSYWITDAEKERKAVLRLRYSAASSREGRALKEKNKTTELIAEAEYMETKSKTWSSWYKDLRLMHKLPSQRKVVIDVALILTVISGERKALITRYQEHVLSRICYSGRRAVSGYDSYQEFSTK